MLLSQVRTLSSAHMASLKGIHSRETAPRLHAEVAQLVEHYLAKVDVASSTLVFRSEMFPSLIRETICKLLINNIINGRVSELVPGAPLQKVIRWFESTPDLI